MFVGRQKKSAAGVSVYENAEILFTRNLIFVNVFRNISAGGSSELGVRNKRSIHSKIDVVLYIFRR